MWKSRAEKMAGTKSWKQEYSWYLGTLEKKFPLTILNHRGGFIAWNSCMTPHILSKDLFYGGHG